VYLRRLGAFCEANKVTPNELLRLRPKKLHDLFLDTVSAMERKGHAGGYIASVLKAVKSWLSFNGEEIRGAIKIRHVY
jgi:hypothetical protein